MTTLPLHKGLYGQPAPYPQACEPLEEAAAAQPADAATTFAFALARLMTAPAARPLALPGLEGVIGADRDSLLRSFGAPRLDAFEGDARKLQFSGSACVLDVYLYPPAAGAPPRATYVEARRATDAREVDRAACVAALRRDAAVNRR